MHQIVATILYCVQGVFSKISRIGGRKGASTTPFVAENPLESQQAELKVTDLR